THVKLPKTVVKEVNSILKRFLWSNGDYAKGKAKIAWKNVCRPKEYGGLGIKNIESWNEALLFKLLWNIASKKDTCGKLEGGLNSLPLFILMFMFIYENLDSTFL
ncbi:hypothetical protein Tco_0346382, partial [Tanacetum coccineum]